MLGVCRRVTGDHHLAEDAFQAVFVVLAAKVASIRPPSALSAWLYGVAYRIALRARTMRDRRLRHEKPVTPLPEPTSSAALEVADADLVAVLDEEIARLPESQRVPVVVCELEGASRQEAAARLGISEGTLSSRLARARRALAERLRRRGIALSAASLTAALAQLGRRPVCRVGWFRRRWRARPVPVWSRPLWPSSHTECSTSCSFRNSSPGGRSGALRFRDLRRRAARRRRPSAQDSGNP